MLPKVLHLMTLVEEGYAIAHVQPSHSGAIAITITRGKETQTITFASYEVPAIHQECNVVGLAK